MTSRQAFTTDQEALDTPAGLPRGQTLREAVDDAMQRYFAHLDGEMVTDLYAMVMAEVEAPLLNAVMAHAGGNQTRAADMLGLNRGTLRKKLKQYDLI
ncbi:DNA-binding transcriptional regulator Fis [Halomonas sp. McH1-25]|uniref:DNA-binding transcriptional regulator Fis n=1 Tax=unclassified Halomonas TaxID=2609666 RepID=UPI001EF4C1B4|nr:MULTISPECIES: DNA-binding transcriptional regulator Fis [unclassified Halomonas]MCG7599124.1 DNA-binding transcriptional regulator Fis [Halomonas sp. McH1-25]MCP1343592.1 DNA-binding transcriptional regulator Fis [Halomonas sp. FL8]MCP1361074.1 DNA-binding transcriptional regulator Fis [Halomonas sp. BBD45]MCP1367687.1 DNA-binding transcriptional regulator Fis [Halomonas sp. BBD48]